MTDNPLDISMLFYFIVILYYFGIFGMIINASIYPGIADNVKFKRNMIYISVGKKKTLIRRTKSEIRFIKRVARGLFSIFMTMVLLFLFFPLVYVLAMKGVGLLKFVGAAL